MSPKSARRTLDAPVRRVTVMEDRAFVRREVHLDAEPGPLKLRVDVAPVLVDKTLDVRAEGATLAEARVRRERLHRHTERGDVGLREKLREATDALKDLEEAMARDTAELADIRRARELLVSEIGEEVAWGQGDPARWTSDFEAATERAEALRVALAEAHAERDRLRRERDDLSARVRAVATPARDEAAWLDLDLHLEAAGSVAITIGYLVPNALWRPQHRATHVPGEGAKVRLETHACVWQNTGEDWEDAELAFSTERPSLGVEPPPLETDRLTVKRKAEHVEVEAREQVVATSGLGRAEAEAPEVPGVDDGGEALELRAAHPANVPSDGRPHRVRLSEAELDAEEALVLVPELEPVAVRRTRQTHEGEAPLLAGPVELVRDGGPAGRTKVLFVAPRERFELGWGPEPSVRVKRHAEAAKEESKLLSSWLTREHTVELKLSNLAAAPREVEVVERVPVSELKEVKVEVDAEATTDGARPDRDGFVRWTVELPPRGRRTLTLVYTVSRKSDVRGL